MDEKHDDAARDGITEDTGGLSGIPGTYVVSEVHEEPRKNPWFFTVTVHAVHDTLRGGRPMSINPQFPTETPNVAISNPKVRERVRTVVDVFGAAIFVIGAVDAAAAGFDLSDILIPAGAAYIAVRSVFGFAVDNRNTPKV